MRSLICCVILVISLTAFHRSHGELLETEFPGTPEEVETPEDEGMLTIFGKITEEDPPVHDWVKATAEEATVAEKLAEAIDDDDDVDSEIARALNVLQSEDMHRFARANRYTQPYPQAYKTPDYPPTSYKADTYRGNTYTTQQYQIPSYQEPYTEEVEYEAAPPTYEEAAEEYPEQVPDESYTGEYGEDSYQPEHYEEEGYVEPEQPYTEEAYPDGTYTEENYPTAETDEPYAPDTYTEDPYQEQEETYPAPPAYPDKPPYPGYPPKVTYPSRPVYPAQPDYVPQPAYPPKPIYQLKPYPVGQYRDDGYGTAEKSGSKGSKRSKGSGSKRYKGSGSKRYKGSGSKRSKGYKSKEKSGYKKRKSAEKKGYKKSGSKERKRYSKEGKGKSGSREKGYKGLKSGEKGGYKRSGSKERKRYSKEKKGKSGSKSKEKSYKKRKSGEKKGYKGSKSNERYNVYTSKPEYRGGDQKDYRYQSGPVYGKYQPTYKGRAGMQDTDGVYEQDYQAPPPPRKSYPKPQQHPASPPKSYPPAGYSGNPCNDKRDQNKCNGYGVTLAWYYDVKAKTCRAYFDKGCKQSKNIFKERVDCSKKCGGDQKPDNYYAEAQKRYGLLGPSTCLHPRSAGNGREQYLSWYFDRETLYCKPFVFSGYFGNANRYDSREQCIQVCSVHMKPKSSYATKTYPPAAPPPAAAYPAALVRG